ncbi:MAG: GGDEF domain-containing protein [Tindallia sp. MSAO_Bac2]|nr:MAG: GGDEF domain-containing protein [Tindallia sp. MSAO_Bac2]
MFLLDSIVINKTNIKSLLTPIEYLSKKVRLLMENPNIWKYFRLPFNQQQNAEFTEKIFFHNNSAILLFSSFLAVEQLIYGLFVIDPLSTTGKIHLLSALVMSVYAVISFIIRRNSPQNISWILKFYTLSFGLFGFYIAITRSLIQSGNFFTIPTVYIAVLYGFAVIFYFSPSTTFVIYTITAAIFMYLLPRYQPVATEMTYVQDIVANNIIAWMASVLNYRRYIKIFENQLTIRETNERLEYLSTTDVLTKVYNRRKLETILKNTHEKSLNQEAHYSLIILDIDHFKQINDSYGHAKGDEILVEMAELIRKNTRKQDQIGRWGGEEFLIICPDTRAEDAYHVAEKIRKLVQNNSFGLPDEITISLGVASYKTGDHIQDLMKRADRSMYNAKEQGRNMVKKSV